MVRGACCSLTRITDEVNALFQRRVILPDSRRSVCSHNIVALLNRKSEKMWEILGSLVITCNPFEKHG